MPSRLRWTVSPGTVNPNKSFSPFNLASVCYFITVMREGAITTTTASWWFPANITLLTLTHQADHLLTPSHHVHVALVLSALTMRAGILKARGPGPCQPAHPHKYMQRRHNSENPHSGCWHSVPSHWSTLVVCVLTPTSPASNRCSFPCPGCRAYHFQRVDKDEGEESHREDMS